LPYHLKEFFLLLCGEGLLFREQMGDHPFLHFSLAGQNRFLLCRDCFAVRSVGRKKIDKLRAQRTHSPAPGAGRIVKSTHARFDFPPLRVAQSETAMQRAPYFAGSASGAMAG